MSQTPIWDILRDKKNRPLVISIGVMLIHAAVTPFLLGSPAYFILMAPSYLASLFLYSITDKLGLRFPGEVLEVPLFLLSSNFYGLMAGLLAFKKIGLNLLVLVLFILFVIIGCYLGFMAAFAFG
jgi:hypothetical protein